MVYRDKARHLVADSLPELHVFAARCGIKRCWFDGLRKGKPHYDIPLYVLKDCSLLPTETQLVDSRTILRLSVQLGRK